MDENRDKGVRNQKSTIKNDKKEKNFFFALQGRMHLYDADENFMLGWMHHTRCDACSCMWFLLRKSRNDLLMTRHILTVHVPHFNRF